MNRYLPMTSALPLLLVLATDAMSSELRLVPSIAVSEEVNDNIREVPEGGRLELVTRVQPGAALHYQAPHSALDASYNLDYRYYARNTRSEEFNHAAALKGLLGLWEDFVTVEAGESYSQVSLDLARDTTKESVLLNQTQQNLATVSAYLTWRPGEKSTLKTGYRFSDTRYGDSSAIDKQTHGVFADYAKSLTDRLELSAGYAYSDTFSTLIRYQQHDISTGLRYEYGDKSFLYGSIGNSWLAYSNALSTSNVFWNAGVSNNFGVAVATLDSRVQYTEDPRTLTTRQTDYTAKLDKELERGRLGISAGYTEYRAALDAGQSRNRYQLNLVGSHELLPKLSAGISATGERLSRSTIFIDLPYHLVATGTLSYAMREHMTLTGSYSHISYRTTLDSSAGSIEVNRGVLEMRMSF